jgi:hypothetical protein
MGRFNHRWAGLERKAAVSSAYLSAPVNSVKGGLGQGGTHTISILLPVIR